MIRLNRYILVITSTLSLESRDYIPTGQFHPNYSSYKETTHYVSGNDITNIHCARLEMSVQRRRIKFDFKL